MILSCFIGIALNIWRDTRGTGGGGLPNGALLQRNGDAIIGRNSNYVVNIPRS